MKTELGEYLACAAIMRERLRRGLCLPRYTPAGWWECDVFEITAAGYFREYEVKLSLKDFRCDMAKQRIVRPHAWGTPERWEKKHDLLAGGSIIGPTEFYYVAPVGLIPPALLPYYAGLIELHDRGDGHRPSWRWTERLAVSAPRLHRTKTAVKHADVMSCCYYRFHDALSRLQNSSAPQVEWTDTAPPDTI